MNPLIEKNIPNAQADWRNSPVTIGALCAHPDEPIIGTLTGLANGVATVSFPSGPDKQFPFNELFDPNVLLRVCKREKDTDFVQVMAKAGLETIVVEI